MIWRSSAQWWWCTMLCSVWSPAIFLHPDEMVSFHKYFSSTQSFKSECNLSPCVCLTPAEKTAALPPSSISSSSSSVVAFPAVNKNHEQTSFFFLWQCYKNIHCVCNQELLTDLQLPSNSSFALVSKVKLGLVVLCHHFYKLFGQNAMLRKIKGHVNTLGFELPVVCLGIYMSYMSFCLILSNF